MRSCSGDGCAAPDPLRSTGFSIRIRIEAARVVVINDPAAARQTTSMVHHLNPGACLIVRTRHVQEVKEFCRLGADEVIPEEFETSVEIFSRVLSRYLVPQEEIERLIAQVRTDG